MPKFSKPVRYFVGFSSLQSRTELKLASSSQTVTFSTETFVIVDMHQVWQLFYFIGDASDRNA